jgi:hypothetical protein
MKKTIFPAAIIVFLIVLSIVGCRKANSQTDVVRTYYPSGELQHELSMMDSLLHGPFTSFYKNGRIEYDKEFNEDSPIGNHYYYDQSGKLLEYGFYDSNSDLRYQLLWDPKQEKYEDEGEPLHVQRTFRDVYHVNDTFYVAPMLANPFKSSYIVGVLSDGANFYKTYQYDSPKAPLFENIIKGNGPITIVSAISREHGILFRRDTLTFNINVKMAPNG